MAKLQGDRADDGVSQEQVDAVMLAAQALVGVTARSVEEIEDRISLAQLRVLMLVASRGRLNLNTLARAMGVHPSNATRACDRLVTAGLLRRVESRVDRRNLDLGLTVEGQRLIDSVVARRGAAVAEVLARVPSSRRPGVAAAMRRFGVAAGEAPAQDAWRLGWPG